MKQRKISHETTLDDLICSKHRQPIRGVCIDKHCTQRYRYICALCKVSHKYDQTEYLDEVLNWDYISKYKFKRMIDALEDRKAKRAHKMDEMEKKINRSFDGLKESIFTIIDENKRSLLTSLREQALNGSRDEILLIHKVFKLKKKAQKVLKKFDPENYLRENLDAHIDTYNDIRSLELKFNEVQKFPLITLPTFSHDCLKIQEDLIESVPKCLDQFFKKDDFKRAKKIMFSFPKFTLDEDHIKVSNLQYYKNPKEDGDETQMEADFAVLSESGSSEGELAFERLILLHFDDVNEILYTQSASKKLVVLDGLEHKKRQFSYPINDEITSSLICHDKQKFYMGTLNGELYVYESPSQNIQKLYEFGAKVTGIAMTNNPFWLTITSDKMLFFLDFTKDPSLFMTYDLIYPISSIIYVPSRDLFTIGFNNGKISCWSCKEKTEVSSKLMASDGIKQITLSEDEKTMFTCSEDGFICLWKVLQSSLALLKVLKINSPLLPPDLLALYQYNLLIVKEDWLLKVFRISDGKLLKKLHLRVYQDYKMLYDKKKAILNLYKTEY